MIDEIIRLVKKDVIFTITFKNHRSQYNNIIIYGKKDFYKWLEKNQEQDKTDFNWDTPIWDKINHIFRNDYITSIHEAENQEFAGEL